jgi:hypothetical protein
VTAPAAPVTVDDAISRLGALAAALAARGWTGQLLTAPGHLTSLHVRRPGAGPTAPGESICAQRRRSGTWTYWSSAAQAIGTDPAAAAAAVIRMLGAAP